jgi:hypothetical protein
MPTHGNAVEPQSSPQQKLDQHPVVKFAPPVKAKDEMYDVHPAHEAKPAPPPKQESKPAPPPKEKEKEKESKPPHGWR